MYRTMPFLPFSMMLLPEVVRAAKRAKAAVNGVKYFYDYTQLLCVGIIHQ